MKKIYWKKLRVLVTNQCNYKCPFCHNEGQEKMGKTNMMSFSNFHDLIKMLSRQKLEEVNFSGGEPFLNKDIIKMIIYADETLSCDISCATNLSLITKEQIDKLSKTRIKFNIQFPYINETLFKSSTGTGKLNKILDNIRLVKAANIDLGLNTVVQSDNIDTIRAMVLFAIKNELPLKLLPQIGGVNSERYKDFIFPILKEYCIEYKDKGTGAIRWTLNKDEHNTTVLYIDSPCFYHDIASCRNYGEIRVHPDLFLQPCINKTHGIQLNLNDGQSVVINKFAELWNNFKTC